MTLDQEKELIWKQHCEEFPKILNWPQRKQETARKAYLAGYNNARNHAVWCIYKTVRENRWGDKAAMYHKVLTNEVPKDMEVEDIIFTGLSPDCDKWLEDNISYVNLQGYDSFKIFPWTPMFVPEFSGTKEECSEYIEKLKNSEVFLKEREESRRNTFINRTIKFVKIDGGF